MDPADIASRYSNEDGMAFLDSIFTDPDDKSIKMIQKIRNILNTLPPIEADILELYYFRHFKQIDIAEIFRVSQPTVCYRLQRASTRIKFLLEMPTLDVEKMREDLTRFFPDPKDAEILCRMYDTTCQSAVAKQMGVTQGFVRHRFVRSIRRMSTVPHMQAYATLFTMISENLNVLREVRKPVRVFCVLD